MYGHSAAAGAAGRHTCVWYSAHSGVKRTDRLTCRQNRLPLMLYKTLSAAVYGIDANLIEVEVDVSGVKTKEEQFFTVGLPDAAVRESRQRVQSALKNCGYDIPPTRIT